MKKPKEKSNKSAIAKIDNPSSDPHKAYFATKQIAKLLEKSNNSRIIAFPSIPSKNGQIEWYKIGGNSAYFYKYIVAPRLGKKPPTIHPDTDLNHRFKDGIIAINNHKAFIENLVKLGYKQVQESGLIIFELNHTFTINEIKALKTRERESKENLNKLFRPKNTCPEIYNLILELSKTIPIKARNLKKGFHDDFAPELNHTIISLNKTYHHFANNRLNLKEARELLLDSADDLTAILSILSENDCLTITDQIRIGRLLIDFKNSVERNLHD